MIPEHSTKIPVTTKILVRFFSRVYIDPAVSFNGTPCWLWQGYIDKHGYGEFRIKGERGRSAHRMSYQMFIARLPQWIHGEQGNIAPDHLCRVRRCVNPVHFEAVTNRINVLRGLGFAARHATKTHCPQGHEYTPENTYPLPGKKRRIVGRGCKTCRKYNPEKRREYFRLWARARRMKLKAMKTHKSKKGPYWQPPSPHRAN